MKNLLGSICFGLFFYLVGCCSVPQQIHHQSQHHVEDNKLSKVESAKKIRDLTVAIINSNPEKPLIHCSGVWIKRGLLLTAHHCVDGVEEQDFIPYVSYGENDKNLNKAFIKGVDELNDLALLYVDPLTEPIHDIAIISDEVIDSGQELNIMGHTMGYGWSYSKGYVSSVRKNFYGPNDLLIEKIIQISSPAWMGNSGGGAFDEKGQLVGICSWVSLSGPLLTFFIHRDIIAKFLEKQNAI